MEAPSTPQRESYSYPTPWPVYALNWSSWPGMFRLGFGSFIEEYKNHISVVSLKNNRLMHVATADVNYPVTKLLWSPLKSLNPDLLATTGDYLRLWELKTYDNDIVKLTCKSTLANIRRGPDFCAPLTAFDWNETDPTMCVTSSIDTTCTVWNIETGQAKTQLIAHDKAVYDVAFARGVDVFASAGADGSIRMFDLRSLEHSTIIYETSAPSKNTTTIDSGAASPLHAAAEQTSLLRLAWNKQDPNYIATFQLNSNSVLILDVRVPATPVSQLTGHSGVVNAIAWAPHSSTHICSVADDSQALVWDISQPKEKIVHDPILAYNADNEINQLSWNSTLHDWIAISSGSSVQALRV